MKITRILNSFYKKNTATAVQVAGNEWPIPEGAPPQAVYIPLNTGIRQYTKALLTVSNFVETDDLRTITVYGTYSNKEALPITHPLRMCSPNGADATGVLSNPATHLSNASPGIRLSGAHAVVGQRVAGDVVSRISETNNTAMRPRHTDAVTYPIVGSIDAFGYVPAIGTATNPWNTRFTIKQGLYGVIPLFLDATGTLRNGVPASRKNNRIFELARADVPALIAECERGEFFVEGATKGMAYLGCVVFIGSTGGDTSSHDVAGVPTPFSVYCATRSSFTPAAALPRIYAGFWPTATSFLPVIYQNNSMKLGRNPASLSSSMTIDRVISQNAVSIDITGMTGLVIGAFGEPTVGVRDIANSRGLNPLTLTLEFFE